MPKDRYPFGSNRIYIPTLQLAKLNSMFAMSYPYTSNVLVYRCGKVRTKIEALVVVVGIVVIGGVGVEVKKKITGLV